MMSEEEARKRMSIGGNQGVVEKIPQGRTDFKAGKMFNVGEIKKIKRKME